MKLHVLLWGAALCLRWSLRAFFCWGVEGLLSSSGACVSHRGSFSRSRAQAQARGPSCGYRALVCGSLAVGRRLQSPCSTWSFLK